MCSPLVLQLRRPFFGALPPFETTLPTFETLLPTLETTLPMMSSIVSFVRAVHVLVLLLGFALVFSPSATAMIRCDDTDPPCGDSNPCEDASHECIRGQCCYGKP